MKRLVKSWVEAEKSYGDSLAEAIRVLNEERGMHVTHSRVSEWRRGVYTPSPLVLSHMLYQSLPWLLEEAEITVSKAQLHALERLIWEFTEQHDGATSMDLL